MNKYWNIIALAAAAAIMAACAPTYPEPTASGLPQASALDVVITVNQETNYVTFVMNNKEMVPVWIFGDQKIDGKASKVYSYTENGVSLRFRDAGEYTVEVKAYNKNGLSQGSVVKTFTMENTYRDPFDPTPYVKAISGGSSQEWVWNNTVDGHFGCGPVGNPLAWWSCGANGKAGFLYDDVMTFDAEGKYTFSSEDGKAYANTGSGYMSDYNTGEDYLFPAPEKTTRYTFENNWNDAGIEEIYLVLEEGSILSYVPDKSAVEEPRFLVMESKTASMKKKLQLMSTVYTPNNPDGISWYYEFVPKGSVAGEADPLYGKESKTWVLDNGTQGYMGCGPSVSDPAGWWSATPHDKDAYGVKDDELTFFKDGKYIFDPGADGVVYVNKDSGYHAEIYSGDGNDYDAPAEKQTSTYTLGTDEDGDYIELPAGILYGYVPNADVINDQPNRLTIKDLKADRMILVANFNGISWQFIFRPKEGQGDEPKTLAEALVGSWTWDADLDGHFGCGPDLSNPLGWWSGPAHCKDDASMYNDVLTFTADGKYTLDPVDGKTYINKGVTLFEDRKAGSPYGDDFDITTEKVTVDYVLDEEGDYEVIKLAAGAMFSYIPTDDFMDDMTLYVKSYSKNQLILMSYTPTGNGGGAIAWQYIMKKVQ